MTDRIRARAREVLKQNDRVHDYWHALMVAKWAEKIRQIEGGDRDVVSAASYMHHAYGYGIGGYNEDRGEEILGRIGNDLSGLGLGESQVGQAIDAIRHHNHYDLEQVSPVCGILQDADRLGATGDIGFERCVYFTTIVKGEPEEKALEFYKKVLIYHTPENMRTEAVRAGPLKDIALERYNRVVERFEELERKLRI